MEGFLFENVSSSAGGNQQEEKINLFKSSVILQATNITNEDLKKWSPSQFDPLDLETPGEKKKVACETEVQTLKQLTLI